MKTIHPHLPCPIRAGLLAACLAGIVHGQSPVPASIAYQGRVSVNGTAFTGMGSFKFALVKQTAPPPTATYESLWSNDGTSVNGSEPTAAVEGIAIQGGQYSVALGDTSLSGMSLALSATVLASHEGLKLRVWFNDGTNGFQQLSPDVVLGAVPYAQVAARVPDGAITNDMVARESLQGDRLVDESVTSAQIAPGTITADRLTPAAADSLSSSLVQNTPVSTFTAKEQINAFDAVAVTTDEIGNARVVPANASEGSRTAFYGFAKNAAAVGQPVVVHQYGPLAGFSSLATGQSYYVGTTNGSISPSGGPAPIYVGHALSNSVLFADAFGVSRRWGTSNYWGDGSDGALNTTGNVNFPSVLDGEVVVKQFTNLTINAGHTVTTATRCRGLVIYVNGDCTINGTLSMTARGANVDPTLPESIPATGIRIVRRRAGSTDTLASSDLGGTGGGGVGAAWRGVEAFQGGISGNGRIYTIAREGGAGAVGVSRLNAGDAGSSIANGTGGGGGGGVDNGGTGGDGARGTCYSGGAGGGGTHDSGKGGNGASMGGAGGFGIQNSGGGAGNPGGGGGVSGENGTGGILLLFVKGNLMVGAAGLVKSEGSLGASGGPPGTGGGGGGGSGGGRIIILHAGIKTINGVVSAQGRDVGGRGSAGGNGDVTVDQINP